jgi:sporulation protein YlmC with PRC-barrel domain
LCDVIAFDEQGTIRRRRRFCFQTIGGWNMKKAALLAAVCAALGVAAMTQPATAADYIKVLDADRVVQPFNVTVGELESADIYAANGEEIGDVEDVLMTADGEIVGLSAEVGGFVGVGEKEVAFALDALVWDGERVIVNMTEEQIGSLPDWD